MYRRAPFVASALLLVIALAVTRPARADQFTGKVVGVTDGDTITVLVEAPGTKMQVKVRLHGIDCPESSQAYGTKAKQFTSAFAFGRVAVVAVTDHDKYGRTVGLVVVDGKSLNQALVDAGLAWAYTQYSQQFVASERAARAAHKGLWADPHPTPPWEFRHAPTGKQSASAGTPSAASVRAVQAPAPKAHDPGTDAVYVTRTGHKYHRDGCRYLSRSQIPVTRRQAEGMGQTPCSICNP